MKVDSLSPWSYYLRYYSYYHHPQFYYHATILRYLFCNLFIPIRASKLLDQIKRYFCEQRKRFPTERYYQSR